MTNQFDPSGIKYLDSENKFTIYTNHTGIAVSLFDIRLIFGQTEAVDGPQAAGVTVVTQGSVLMTPLHAKLLCANLQTNIQTYETKFGEIMLPPTQPQALVAK